MSPSQLRWRQAAAAPAFTIQRHWRVAPGIDQHRREGLRRPSPRCLAPAAASAAVRQHRTHHPLQSSPLHWWIQEAGTYLGFTQGEGGGEACTGPGSPPLQSKNSSDSGHYFLEGPFYEKGKK